MNGTWEGGRMGEGRGVVREGWGRVVGEGE